MLGPGATPGSSDKREKGCVVATCHPQAQHPAPQQCWPPSARGRNGRVKHLRAARSSPCRAPRPRPWRVASRLGGGRLSLCHALGSGRSACGLAGGSAGTPRGDFCTTGPAFPGPPPTATEGLYKPLGLTESEPSSGGASRAGGRGPGGARVLAQPVTPRHLGLCDLTWHRGLRRCR